MTEGWDQQQKFAAIGDELRCLEKNSAVDAKYKQDLDKTGEKGVIATKGVTGCFVGCSGASRKPGSPTRKGGRLNEEGFHWVVGWR